VPRRRAGGPKAEHLAPLLLFAVLAVAWTWPLAVHLGDALAGGPGDNYSFVWNLWWMRHVLATPGLAYFHTTHLFYPFGTTIADHPHTALPALIAATVLEPASIVTAQNVLLIAYVFANMTAMYALAWTITHHTRASILAALVFGLSPYLAVHLLGHFDLVAAFTLPLYALAFREALGDSHTIADPQSASRNRQWAAVAAGVVLAATAYIAYYYVVYLLFFTIVYLLAWVSPIVIGPATTRMTSLQRRLRLLAVSGAVIFTTAAAAIVATGGRTIAIGPTEISLHTPQNALTIAWMFVAGALVLTWRRSIGVNGDAASGWTRAIAVAWRVAAAFVVGAAPLFWQAARLVARGEYVTPEYGWRSIPHGVDLLAPLLGHPLHPLWHSISARAYGALGQNYVEVIGWMGLVPLLLLLVSRRSAIARDELRIWRVVAVTFVIWALGPFLTIGGFDTGLKLPAILLRYVPFVANARMPGRAMVGLFMALGVLLAIQVAGSTGRLRSAALQWLAIALVVFEFWDAPVPTTMIDRPAVYQALAAAEPGAVCEVPLGIGDGLSVGVGSQDRRVLYYATQHEHPLVGGYIGRMPADAADRYQRTPIVGMLLALSDGAALPANPDVNVAASPCPYLVVHRAATPTTLASYLQLLAPQRLATDSERDLYRIR
jgi:hypothetical protein